MSFGVSALFSRGCGFDLPISAPIFYSKSTRLSSSSVLPSTWLALVLVLVLVLKPTLLVAGVSNRSPSQGVIHRLAKTQRALLGQAMSRAAEIYRRAIIRAVTGRPGALHTEFDGTPPSNICEQPVRTECIGQMLRSRGLSMPPVDEGVALLLEKS